MELKDFVLAVFQDGKTPESVKGVKQAKQLDEIHDLVTLYFVDRDAGTVSALKIEEYFPIDKEKGGVVRGEWDLGGYNNEKSCYYSMGRYPITRFPSHQTFVTQERLDKDEVYIEDLLAGLFESR